MKSEILTRLVAPNPVFCNPEFLSLVVLTITQFLNAAIKLFLKLSRLILMVKCVKILNCGPMKFNITNVHSVDILEAKRSEDLILKTVTPFVVFSYLLLTDFDLK